VKPIRIFRHVSCEGPGYLGQFLDRRGAPWQLVCIDADQPVPQDLGAVSGLVFMGGAMSVNDPLDWIVDEMRLIGNALAEGVPILGICFGGQLLCKALGGDVWRGDGMEIGWHPVERVDDSGAAWLDGVAPEFEAFHWHAETFTIPAGAEHLLRSRCYANQAFAWGDHLAMQFHLEMTEEMVRAWIDRYGSDLDLDSRCIQQRQAVTADLRTSVRRLNRVADQIYSGWLQRVRARQAN
jgi:GMP synthase-like glutamine amidotransferase